MSIQTNIDSLMGNSVSVFNLALNVAGLINNKKNVAIYKQTEAGLKGENILESSLGRLSGITGVANAGVAGLSLDDSGVIMSAEIVENSKLAEHPLEDGKVLADNKILLPTEINIQITLQAQDYRDRLRNIRDYKDNRQMLYVETKYGVFDNMQIVSIPCNLNADNVNRITFTIKLRQVLVAQNTKNKISANVKDMSSENIGLISGSSSDSLIRSA